MTAVRPHAGANQRSPMTKVMDLFRHRSNSAVSEADKRKAVSVMAKIKACVLAMYICGVLAVVAALT